MLSSKVFSEPIELFFDGWRSDTLTLQRCGWDISANQDLYRDRIAIAIKHRNSGLTGVTYFEEFLFDRGFGTSGRRNPRSLPIALLAKDIAVYHAQYSTESFRPVDATPRVAEVNPNNKGDYFHFATIEPPKHEVFLKEASIDQILQMALEKQEPEQQKIRERMIKDQELQRFGQLHTQLRIV